MIVVDAQLTDMSLCGGDQAVDGKLGADGRVRGCRGSVVLVLTDNLDRRSPFYASPIWQARCTVPERGRGSALALTKGARALHFKKVRDAIMRPARHNGAIKLVRHNSP
jgi:hypothetical protein